MAISRETQWELVTSYGLGTSQKGPLLKDKHNH
jgi:hypothetical protein